MLKRTLLWIAVVLLIIGGINWGLVGLLNFDFVAALLGAFPLLLRLVYILVGVSAGYLIYILYERRGRFL